MRKILLSNAIIDLDKLVRAHMSTKKECIGKKCFTKIYKTTYQIILKFDGDDYFYISFDEEEKANKCFEFLKSCFGLEKKQTKIEVDTKLIEDAMKVPSQESIQQNEKRLEVANNCFKE